MGNTVYLADNLSILKKLDDESIHLFYIKPPSAAIGEFKDFQDDMFPRIQEAFRCLTKNGVLYFQSNSEIVHYCKVKILDAVFQQEGNQFVNEIIWTFESDIQPKNKWAPRHETILVYAKGPSYTFNHDDIDRIKYMAPGLVSEEKIIKGKSPTDTWWFSNIESNGEGESEESSLPIHMIKRIILASSNEEETVMDMYARNGNVGLACLDLNRNFILVDKSKKALKKMAKRLGAEKSVEWINFNPNQNL